MTNLRIELRTSRQLKSQKYQVSEISGIKNVGYQKYQVLQQTGQMDLSAYNM